MSDGNVAFEGGGGGILHSFNCTPAFVIAMSYMRLADALVFILLVRKHEEVAEQFCS